MVKLIFIIIMNFFYICISQYDWCIQTSQNMADLCSTAAHHKLGCVILLIRLGCNISNVSLRCIFDNHIIIKRHVWEGNKFHLIILAVRRSKVLYASVHLCSKQCYFSWPNTHGSKLAKLHHCNNHMWSLYVEVSSLVPACHLIFCWLSHTEMDFRAQP